MNLKKEIKKLNVFEKGDRVLLAVSGGMDSIVMLHLINEISKEVGFEFSALFINLGIDDFSTKSMEIVKKNCKQLGVPLIIVDIKEDLGFGIEEISKNLDQLKTFRKRSVCHICSIIKRYWFMKISLEEGFNKFATAHTLEDFISFVFSFLIDGNVEVITRWYPIVKTKWGVSKVKPLILISEDEIKDFAIKNKINFLKDDCKFSSQNESVARKLTQNLTIEERKKLAKNFLKILSILSQKYMVNIKKCKLCGMPTFYDKCSYCRLKEELVLTLT